MNCDFFRRISEAVGVNGKPPQQIDVTEKEEKGEHFIVRKLDDSCLSDPVINLIYSKVKHMGRNVELLVTLDRISDMWEMNAERDGKRMSILSDIFFQQFENCQMCLKRDIFIHYNMSICIRLAAARVSLNDEFLNEVTLQFSKYTLTDNSDSVDAVLPIEEASRTAIIDPEIDDNVMQQMSKIDNPFLMKGFELYLPMDLCPSMDDVDAKYHDKVETIAWGRCMFRSLESISATAVLPFRKVLENALAKVLDQRYSCASKLVKDILVSEYKLEGHMKLMRCVYMMERGHIMTQFYQQMFNEVCA